MERFLQERAFQADYHEQLADARAEAERDFLLTVLGKRKQKTAITKREAGSWLISAGT